MAPRRVRYAGVVAIENMGGPDCGFTPGRSDAPKPDTPPSKDKRFTPDDRLPDAAQGAQHLRDVFYRIVAPFEPRRWR